MVAATSTIFGDHVHYVQVFLNICTSELIQAPDFQKRLDAEGNETEVYYMPVSLGPPRVHKDKAGADSTVYDIVFNPQVGAVSRSRCTWMWYCQFVETTLSHESKTELDTAALLKCRLKAENQRGFGRQGRGSER